MAIEEKKIRSELVRAMLMTHFYTAAAEIGGTQQVSMSEVGRQKLLGLAQFGGNLGVLTLDEYNQIESAVTSTNKNISIGQLLLSFDKKELTPG